MVSELQKNGFREQVIIPSTLPAGDYVLGWRYDCEETAQVWQNCADVTLVAPDVVV